MVIKIEDKKYRANNNNDHDRIYWAENKKQKKITLRKPKWQSF